MLKFVSIKKKLIEKLTEGLPEHLYYHSPQHTLYVIKNVIFIGEKENVSKKDMFLLKLAALYHDVGFIDGSENHEEKSCKIAKRELAKAGLSKEQIEKICGMIMATKIPQQPKNLLEEILADADLEYLGTKQFSKIGDQLYEELKHSNSNYSKKQWNKLQISFLSNHRYHTKFCRQYREKYKKKHLQQLISNS